MGIVITSCEKEEALDETPIETELTAVELEMMHHMMEEEKLAYDVYVTLFELHGTSIFDNISKSEQTHMDAASELLAKYNIENTASTTLGVFNESHLQELYDALVVMGSQSLIDALKVGATIEDVDIYDLEEYLGITENADIISVFDFLNCGSRNHLRGFMSQLDLLGADYTPQYITQDRFDEIVYGGHEVCNVYTLD